MKNKIVRRDKEYYLEAGTVLLDSDGDYLIVTDKKDTFVSLTNGCVFAADVIEIVEIIPNARIIIESEEDEQDEEGNDC